MPVTVAVTLTNPAGQPPTVGSVRLTAAHLASPMTPMPLAQPFRLAPGASQTLRFIWHPPRADFQGYLVAAQARDLFGHVFETRTTAVDVSSQWTKFPRYGFLSGYPAQSAAVSREEIRQMRDYHLNAIQFYDWQWRHEKPLAGTVASPAASWKDLAGRLTYRQTILDLIAAGHDCGMATLNYNLLYGAGPATATAAWIIIGGFGTGQMEQTSIPFLCPKHGRRPGFICSTPPTPAGSAI